MDPGFKKFTFIHDRLAIKMNRCLEETDTLEWRTKGKTTLIQIELQKITAPNNYKLIMCLSIMWKILTEQIRENIYYSLISGGLFPEIQGRMPQGNKRKRRSTIN